MKTMMGALFVGLCLAAIALPPARAAQSAPTLQELKNATYRGLEDTDGPVTLKDGQWAGKPFVEGGASRPTVSLVGDFRLTGDLDGDGRDEAAVLLVQDSGGSGSFYYLAVVARRNGKLENVATRELGDRLGLRDARIEKGLLMLQLVQAGPKDAACCPGQLVWRGWKLTSAGLKEQPALGKSERLSPDAMGGVTWVLRAWNHGQPAQRPPEITLVYKDGRFTGFSGCNQYFADVKPGEMPGDVKVGPLGATRRACPDKETQAESRFQRQLSGVTQFGFMATRLALGYSDGGAHRVMLFERRSP